MENTNSASDSGCYKIGGSFFVAYMIGFVIRNLPHISVKHQKHLFEKGVPSGTVKKGGQKRIIFCVIADGKKK